MPGNGHKYVCHRTSPLKWAIKPAIVRRIERIPEMEPQDSTKTVLVEIDRGIDVYQALRQLDEFNELGGRSTLEYRQC